MHRSYEAKEGREDDGEEMIGISRTGRSKSSLSMMKSLSSPNLSALFASSVDDDDYDNEVGDSWRLPEAEVSMGRKGGGEYNYKLGSLGVMSPSSAVRLSPRSTMRTVAEDYACGQGEGTHNANNLNDSNDSNDSNDFKIYKITYFKVRTRR